VYREIAPPDTDLRCRVQGSAPAFAGGTVAEPVPDWSWAMNIGGPTVSIRASRLAAIDSDETF
jgi:hypothetical protein